MLPDYTETKHLFSHFFQTYARRKSRAFSPLADVQTHYLHEGRGMKVIRDDQSESESQAQSLSSIMELRFDEIPDLTFEKVLARFDEMIVDMVRKQTKYALEKIGEDLPESHNLKAEPQQSDAELILKMLETIQMEFYPDGTPHELHVLGGPFTPQRLKAAHEEAQNNPELKQRFDDLLEQKREAWRAREATRKLVG